MNTTEFSEFSGLAEQNVRRHARRGVFGPHAQRGPRGEWSFDPEPALAAYRANVDHTTTSAANLVRMETHRQRACGDDDPRPERFPVTNKLAHLPDGAPEKIAASDADNRGYLTWLFRCCLSAPGLTHSDQDELDWIFDAAFDFAKRTNRAPEWEYPIEAVRWAKEPVS